MLYLQTWGLSFTSVAKSGFLTTLYVFLTPLLGMILFGHRYPLTYWLLILVGLLGIFLLVDMKFDGFNFGDFLTLLCALCAAFHIIAVEKVTHLFSSALIFNCFQIFFVSVLSSIVFISKKGVVRLDPLLDLRSYSLWGFFILSIMSSIVAFTFQASAQKKLPAHVVSMLFLLESPFAALMGYLLLGETLSPTAILGSGIILLSVGLVPIVAKSNQASP
jgi:drug/metabolite transporter (DMT)-like permease